MNLIPPTHGRAEVRRTFEKEAVAAIGGEAVCQQLLRDMDSIFHREVGATAPREWLRWLISHSPAGAQVDVSLKAEAPTRGRTYLDAFRGVVRAAPLALTTESQIPIVPSSYRYENPAPFRRADHVLTFAGWDADTGLMVFDR